MLVLAMMFSVPLFTITTYKEENSSYKFGLEIVHKFKDHPLGRGFNASFHAYVEQHKDIRTPLIYVNCLNVSTWTGTTNVNPFSII